LTLNDGEIVKLVESLESESKTLKKLLFQMSWYMRGSISIEQAFQLDFENREIISSIINENLETTKETGLSFF
jgi:hypothetical protein